LGPLRETEIAADRCLALPFFAGLEARQVALVARELRRALAEEFEPVAAPVAFSNPSPSLRERV